MNQPKQLMRNIIDVMFASIVLYIVYISYEDLINQYAACVLLIIFFIHKILGSILLYIVDNSIEKE